MRYKVTITETLEMEVEVNAKSREEAEQKIEAQWRDGEYILDAECFSKVEFCAKERSRTREDYER